MEKSLAPPCPQLKKLMKDLKKARFENRGGKGSHRNFVHPTGVRYVLSGNLGDDAHHYQEKDVRQNDAELDSEREIMNNATDTPHYTLVVEWSDEDQCYIRRCPELFGGGVHGRIAWRSMKSFARPSMK